MSLIVEDGTGVSNANTYIPEIEANALLAEDMYASGWIDLTAEQKEATLKSATRYLDMYFDYSGDKVYADASLRWPRRGVYDLDGVAVSSGAVPAPVKYATARLAWELAKKDRVSEPDTQGISELKVDVIELKFDKYDRPKLLPSIVTQIMRGYGSAKSVGRTAKLVRS